MTKKPQDAGLPPVRWYELCDPALLAAYRAADAAWAKLEPEWRGTRRQVAADRNYVREAPLPAEGKAVKAALAAVRDDYRSRLLAGRIVITGCPAGSLDAARVEVPVQYLTWENSWPGATMTVRGVKLLDIAIYRSGDFARLAEAPAATGGGRKAARTRMRVKPVDKERRLEKALARLFAEKPYLSLEEKAGPAEVYREACGIDSGIPALWVEASGIRKVSPIRVKMRGEVKATMRRRAQEAIAQARREVPALAKMGIGDVYESACKLDPMLADFWTKDGWIAEMGRQPDPPSA